MSNPSLLQSTRIPFLIGKSPAAPTEGLPSVTRRNGGKKRVTERQCSGIWVGFFTHVRRRLCENSSVATL